MAKRPVYRALCVHWDHHPDPKNTPNYGAGTDAEHQLHINHWAWIKTRVPAARAREFAAYPPPAGGRHWLFRHGLAGLGNADHHSCRLYAWDGKATHLLAESFREGVRGLQ